MRVLRTLILLASASTLSACAVVTVGSSGSAEVGDHDRRLPSASPVVRTADEETNRRVCRNARRPSGWIAIDYVDDQAACHTTEAKYGTAVLMRVSTLAVGRTIEVCADQPYPRNWKLVRRISDSPSCPRQPGSTNTAPTVMEIQRLR